MCTSTYDRPDDPEPILYCAECGWPIERVSIPVLTTKYHSVTCCSEICADTLRAKLDDDGSAREAKG